MSATMPPAASPREAVMSLVTAARQSPLSAKGNLFVAEHVRRTLDSLEALPAALQAAFSRFAITSAHDKDWKRIAPFFVVDESTAEPDMNWPGELVSEHATYEAARLALMAVILRHIGVLPA